MKSTMDPTFMGGSWGKSLGRREDQSETSGLRSCSPDRWGVGGGTEERWGRVGGTLVCPDCGAGSGMRRGCPGRAEEGRRW